MRFKKSPAQQPGINKNYMIMRKYCSRFKLTDGRI